MNFERHRPCLHTVQDLQPGETPRDCGGRALKSCSSLLMRTSWMQPWKPPSGRSVPWRRAERPVEVGMPGGGAPVQPPEDPPLPASPDLPSEPEGGLYMLTIKRS